MILEQLVQGSSNHDFGAVDRAGVERGQADALAGASRVPHEPVKRKHRADIDGLRAVAILSVLLFHAELGCTGGFVGVDVFFVISGFLISSLILDELDGGNFSLVRFWERRIRRILPASMVVVTAVIVAAWFLYLPEDFQPVGQSAAAQATFLANVYFWQGNSYFSATPETKPLLHMWSLAVEEQFYLLFPACLMFLARFKRKRVTILLAIVAVASFELSIFETQYHQSGSFYLLPTRAWELLIGALLALTKGRILPGPLAREALGWAGIVLIGYAVIFYDQTTRFPGPGALAPCFGAAFIILSSEVDPSSVGRILSFKPIVFIGLISYSLYLWHWPLLVFVKYTCLPATFKSVGLRGGLLLASVALASVTWRYVETPVRTRQVFRTRRQIFRFAIVSTVTICALGIWIFHAQGVPSRLPAQTLAYADARNHNGHFLNNLSLAEAKAGKFSELGSAKPDQPITLMIMGDSHAMSVAPVIDELCRQYGWRGVEVTHWANPPVVNFISDVSASLGAESPAFVDAVLAYVSEKRIKTVILAAYWSYYAASDQFKADLLATVRAFTAAGAKVYVLEDVPAPEFDVPRFAALTSLRHGDLEQLGLSRRQYAMTESEINKAFEEIPRTGVTLLDPSTYFLNRQGIYGVIKNGQILYADSHHLSVEGARNLAPLFQQLFTNR
jgi:peptidoglycan/LPS O-acetylase OafA/YrhL